MATKNLKILIWVMPARLMQAKLDDEDQMLMQLGLLTK
ncbi:hypothetical protein MIZ03_1129 [Rhodoferax lithotrophicus]|uniref:Uncharacterized protein n=1 Tax=Rhodoferax lithotrophicus TaxID=2798804 RepID=A0ABM7MJ14_9BURK|nr:hypothetical protein MIZ03_1129 [Rhodoferax sp. MIZ03]